MKIKEINKTNLRMMHQEINKVLAKYGQEIGVAFTAGNASYTAASATIKLNITVVEKSDAVKEQEEEANAMMSRLFGFDENIVGKSFKTHGDTMTIIRIDHKKRKYPIIMQSALDGKTYKMIPEYIKSKLSTQ